MRDLVIYAAHQTLVG